jgi:hypothetical protein
MVSVGPIITFQGRIIGREYVDRLDNQVHAMIQLLFPISVVFQDDSAPFTWPELFSHGLKSVEVNFPGKHIHII